MFEMHCVLPSHYKWRLPAVVVVCVRVCTHLSIVVLVWLVLPVVVIVVCSRRWWHIQYVTWIAVPMRVAVESVPRLPSVLRSPTHGIPCSWRIVRVVSDVSIVVASATPCAPAATGSGWSAGRAARYTATSTAAATSATAASTAAATARLTSAQP